MAKANQSPAQTPPPTPAPADRKPFVGSAGYRVRTPHAGFRGTRCGVTFTNGVGETPNVRAAEQCAALGYTVECIATGKRLHPQAK